MYELCNRLQKKIKNIFTLQRKEKNNVPDSNLFFSSLIREFTFDLKLLSKDLRAHIVVLYNSIKTCRRFEYNKKYNGSEEDCIFIVPSATQRDSPNSKPSKEVSKTKQKNSPILNSLKNRQEPYKQRSKVSTPLL